MAKGFFSKVKNFIGTSEEREMKKMQREEKKLERLEKRAKREELQSKIAQARARTSAAKSIQKDFGGSMGGFGITGPSLFGQQDMGKKRDTSKGIADLQKLSKLGGPTMKMKKRKKKKKMFNLGDL